MSRSCSRTWWRTAVVMLAAGLALPLAAGPAAATDPPPAPGYAPGVSSWGVLQVAYRRVGGGVTVDFGVSASDLGGAVSTGPAAMPFRGTGPSTKLWVAAAGTNGALYFRHQTDSPPYWTNWTSAGGYTTGNPALACSGGMTHPVVFVRGADGALWRRVLEHPSGWWRIGGVITSAPATVTPLSGQCQVFEEVVAAIGGDGAVWESRNQVWGRVGGRSDLAPSITRTPAGSTHVFVIGTDRALWTASRASDAAPWSGFTKIGGIWTSAPAATVYPNDTFSVVALGGNNQLYTATRSVAGPGPWTFTHLP
jgi:hypothetical protein